MNPWQRFWLVLRDLRIWWISTFNPEYFDRKLSQRKGSCPEDCGLCCELGSDCALYDKDTKNAGIIASVMTDVNLCQWISGTRGYSSA